MNAIPQDELIGAYLDGELTAEERARVEQLLAESPECRQLLDDLRAVRESLQALPRLSLEPDFSDKVLREAERRMLTAAPGGKDSALRRAEPPTLRHRTWRPVLVSGLAVAAALVVMFLNRPGFLGEGPVDKGPVAMAPAAAEPAAEEAPATRGLARGEGAPVSDRGPRASTSSLAVEGQAGDAMKGELGVKFSEKRPGVPDLAKDRLDTEVLSEPAAVGQKAGRPSKEMNAKSEAPPAAGLAVDERAFDNSNATQLRYGQETLDRSQQGAGGYGGMGGMGGGAPMGGVGPAGMGRGGPVAGAAPAVPFGSPVDKMGKVAAQDKKAASGEGESLGEPLLIVQCEITPEAARNHALDNVLLKQRIAWGETPEGVIAEGKPLPAGEKRDRNADLTRQSVAGAGALGDVDLVYVEAAPEQIQATLAALSNRPDLFMAVAVSPTPGEQVDSFQYYYQPQDVGGGQRAGGTSSGAVNGALSAPRMAKAKVSPAPPAPADGTFRAGGRQGIARRIRLLEDLDQRKELEAAKKIENQPQQARPDQSHYADTPVELKATQPAPSAPAAKPSANEGKAGEAPPEPAAASTAAGPSLAPAKGQEATAPKTPAVVASPLTVAKESPPASSSVGGAGRPSTGAAGQQREYVAQQPPETMRVLFVVRVVRPSASAAVAMPANEAAEPPAEVHTETAPAQQVPAVQPPPVKP